MASSRRLTNLGPPGLLLRDQPTLRHAPAAMVRHAHFPLPPNVLPVAWGPADQPPASSPLTTMLAWISAAPSNTLRMRASHSTRLMRYSSA